jgi:proteasome lid subunit RPN8/RPN11
MSRSKAPPRNSLRSLVLTPHQLAAIVHHSEDAYPAEACGLIVGTKPARGRCVASRVVGSANLATGDARHRFEVDPALRFKLERELRDTGEAVIGHYHSHPDHPAAPSARDIDEAYEPELVWLIVSVEAGRARACGAYRLEREAKRSQALALHLADDRELALKPRPRQSARKTK